MASVTFDAVTKKFGDTAVVVDLSLEIADREFLVLLGPSGCGKSTALRMIAGLEEPTEGTVCIDDEVMNGVDPRDRDVAMVFQSYALYPHMTVAKNIEAPLVGHRVVDELGVTRKLSADERDELVRHTADTLGLTDFLERKPGALSGGQRQRVALARAIVRRPRAFLMDEPLSNLDAELRMRTRIELVELWRRLQTTVVYVTHDQVEAMTMATRIAVLADGRLQQVGTPAEVYHQPANLFVATFIGSPRMNTFQGKLRTSGDAATVNLAGAEVAVACPVEVAAGEEREVILGVRAEHLRLVDDGPLVGSMRIAEDLGHEHHVVCDVGSTMVTLRLDGSSPVPSIGDEVHLAFDPDRALLFDQASGARL